MNDHTATRSPVVRPLGADELGWIRELFTEWWGGAVVVSRGGGPRPPAAGG
ncbi:MAG: hypothetical protein IRZ07_24800 [Microbispora sp.]|nr:hypothetical protein [Microbispora sp.]